MGLDMYLKAEKYLSDYGRDEDKEKKDKIRELFPEIKETGNLDSVGVKFEIGYWRKANAIHSWFVNNIQGGKDECQSSYVDRDDLATLRDLCRQILDKSKVVKGMITNGQRVENGKWVDIKEEGEYIENPEIAQELLPATSGFFFGSTEYDEYYLNDIKRTIEIIDYALSLPDSYEISYRASW